MGPRRISFVWAALGIYAGLSLLVFSSTWIDPTGSWIGSPKDPKLFIWYLGWIPHELSEGHNPLFTDYLSYPAGVNLMWNTSMIFPALVLWPVTAVFGAVVAYNVLITAGIALSAWVGLLAARRFIDNTWLCLVAGFIYGFSPALLAQALGHPHVMVALFPPIALILGHEILVRRRVPPTRAGALAGLAAALQLLTGEELLAVTLMVAAIGVAFLALLHRAEVRSALPHAAKAAGAAFVTFILVAGYPLAFQFLGPQRVSGNFQPPDVYVSDVAAFILPAPLVHITGNATENGAYVGLPLVLLFIAGLIAGWRRPWMRWTALITIVVAVLSLGPHPHVNGHVIPIPLPWALVGLLPLMGSALPARLMAIAFLGVGMVTAGASRMAMTAGRPWRIAADALLAVGLVAIVPMLPYPSVPAGVPAFFRPGGDVEKLLDGSVILVTPFSSKASTDAMYWQAVANYRFRMPEGDAFTPGPYLGPHPSFMKAVIDNLDAGTAVEVTPDVRARFVADLKMSGITGGIVVGPSPGQAAIVSFLTAIEGSPPTEDGGVKVWWFHSIE
jgi:hypothetical protein